MCEKRVLHLFPSCSRCWMNDGGVVVAVGQELGFHRFRHRAINRHDCLGQKMWTHTHTTSTDPLAVNYILQTLWGMWCFHRLALSTIMECSYDDGEKSSSSHHNSTSDKQLMIAPRATYLPAHPPLACLYTLTQKGCNPRRCKTEQA